MSLADLVPLALAVMVLALTPGPIVVTTIATAAARGAMACAGLLAGTALADIILIGLVLAGMGAVATAIGPWFGLVKLVGGGYLIWMGVKLWRDRGEATARIDIRRGFWKGFAAGLLLNLSNPKALIFYAAFLPTFVDIASLSTGDSAIVIAVMLGIIVTVNAGFALAAGRLGRFIRSSAAAKRVNRASGTVMIGAGVAVATR